MTKLYLALPASGKSTFAKNQGRDHVVDLDIPGSRYIAHDPTFAEAAAAIALVALAAGKDVVTHYNYLDLGLVMRGAEDRQLALEVVCVLPHDSMVAAQADRVLARSSSDNKFLEDVEAQWESWVCKAYAEAQRLAKSAAHYKHVSVSAEFLTPKHPFMGQTVDEDLVQSYHKATEKALSLKAEESELEDLLFQPDGHLSDHEVAVLVHRYQVAKMDRAYAAAKAARAFTAMSVEQRQQALKTSSSEVKE